MTTIVIGAGMAGIAAASEIPDSVLIDARDYLGGRLLTSRIPFEPMELGAGWFHDAAEKDPATSANPLVKLALESKIRIEYDDEDVRVVSLDGKADAQLAQQWDDFRTEHPETTIEQAAAQFESVAGAAGKAYALGQSFLAGTGLLASKISSKYKVGGGRDMVAVHGYDAILKPLIAKISQSNIHLDTPVESISVNGDEVVVHSPKGTFKGSKVIVTVPVSVLKEGSISFKPALPSAIQTAVSSASVAKIGKVYVEFNKCFWDKAFDKTLVADADPALIYNWSKVHKSDRHILSVLVVNETCDAAEKEHSPEAIWKIVSKFFEAINTSESPVPKPTFVRSSKWSKDPYALGAISAFERGSERSEAVAAFEKGADRILFAGEHTTMEGAACLHGAYLSGLRAAKQALGK